MKSARIVEVPRPDTVPADYIWTSNSKRVVRLRAAGIDVRRGDSTMRWWYPQKVGIDLERMWAAYGGETPGNQELSLARMRLARRMLGDPVLREAFWATAALGGEEALRAFIEARTQEAGR